MMRIGIVGLGGWSSDMHLPTCAQLQEEGSARYVAVCDLNPELRASAAALLQAKPYDDFDRMLAQESLDGVVIVVPAGLSGRFMRAAVKAGLPFMTEKPPAADLQEHRSLMATVADTPHVVAYNRRFTPFATSLREWLGGEEILSFRGRFSRVGRYDPDFTTTAIHGIDTMQFFLSDRMAELVVRKTRDRKVDVYQVQAALSGGGTCELMIHPADDASREEYCFETKNAVFQLDHPMEDGPEGCAAQAGPQGTRRALRLRDLRDSRKQFSGGIRGEHLHFLQVAQGEVASIATLGNTLLTQQIRETLVRCPYDVAVPVRLDAPVEAGQRV